MESRIRVLLLIAGWFCAVAAAARPALAVASSRQEPGQRAGCRRCGGSPRQPRRCRTTTGGHRAAGRAAQDQGAKIDAKNVELGAYYGEISIQDFGTAGRRVRA
jgi:hypothetical protein